jgi:membrane protein
VLSELFSQSLFARVLKRAADDLIFDRCAQLSYYFLLALFPLLLFLLTLFGYIYETGSRLHDQLISYLASVVPRSALQMVVGIVDEVSVARGSGKLSFGLLASLWASSSGMIAIGRALNAAYAVRETRSWWKLRLIAVILTIGLAALIISALLLVLYGGGVGEFLALRVGFGDAFLSFWKFAQWPIALLFVLGAFVMIYRWAPDLSAASERGKISRLDYRRRWLSPGVIVAVILWLAVSLVFRLYLHFFDSYSATYGSLGALIVLMLWFYLTGAAILLGGEVNCELDCPPHR